MAEYTNGIWEVTQIKDKVFIDSPAFTIAELRQKSSLAENRQETLANANLIAAAPRMAKLLERLVNDGWNAGISEEAQEILFNIKGR